MFATLMSSRRFAPLFWTQFLAALNDTFLKQSFIIFVTFGDVATAGKAGPLVQIAGAALIAPFFLLSGLAGELADKYDKAIVARRVKFAEIFATGLAALGFTLHSVPALLLAIAVFGTLATLFGPIKYGTLPEQLKTSELVAGNALIESATFAAIIIGTVGGGYTTAKYVAPWVVAAAMLAVSVGCWLAARQMPKSRPADPAIRVRSNPLASALACCAT